MRTPALAVFLLMGCSDYGLSPYAEHTPTPLDQVEIAPGSTPADAPDGQLAEWGNGQWDDPVDEGAAAPTGSDDPSGDPSQTPWDAPVDKPSDDELEDGLDTPSESTDDPSPDDEQDDWWNDPWTEPPVDQDDDAGDPPHPLRGLARMTGGGAVDDLDRENSHGFTLHCEFSHHANNMTVSLPEGTFYLDDVEWVHCLDDPALDSQQPEQAFDTVVGVAWGTLDGEAVDVWFQLSDDGEPGLDDHGWWVFDTPQGTIEVFGYLVDGNHQVHDPVGQ